MTITKPKYIAVWDDGTIVMIDDVEHYYIINYQSIDKFKIYMLGSEYKFKVSVEPVPNTRQIS